MRKLIGIYLAAFMAIAMVACQSNKEVKVSSAVFEWDKLPIKKTSTGELREIYKGPTRSLEKLVIKAVTLNGGKNLKSYKIENGSDELIIVKDGTIDISVNDDNIILREGSVMVAFQGDDVEIKNETGNPATFFSFLYNPKGPEPEKRLAAGSKPLVVDWDSLEFKANENGGRRDLLRQPTEVLRELEMHATTLKAGASSHAGHSHPDEEIVLMRRGSVDETINDETKSIGVGSMMLLTNDDVHGVSNSANSEACEYYAFRWLVAE